MEAFGDSDCADALLQIRGHPLTISRTPFDDSADTFDDSADILDDAAEKLDYRPGESADFVKFLVTCTACTHTSIKTTIVTDYMYLHTHA